MDRNPVPDPMQMFSMRGARHTPTIKAPALDHAGPRKLEPPWTRLEMQLNKIWRKMPLATSSTYCLHEK